MIVIEVTVSGIPVSAALSAQGDRFRDEVRRKILPKIRQLDRVIGDVNDGTLVLPGVDLTTIKHIRPLLVTLQPFPRLVNTWDIVKEFIQTEELLRQPNVEPFEVAAVEEAEMLEPHIADGSLVLSDVMRDKDNHIVGKHSSLKNYLFLGRGFKERDNSTIRALYFEAAKEVGETLVRLGVVTTIPAQPAEKEEV